MTYNFLNRKSKSTITKFAISIKVRQTINRVCLKKDALLKPGFQTFSFNRNRFSITSHITQIFGSVYMECKDRYQTMSKRYPYLYYFHVPSLGSCPHVQSPSGSASQGTDNNKRINHTPCSGPLSVTSERIVRQPKHVYSFRDCQAHNPARWRRNVTRRPESYSTFSQKKVKRWTIWPRRILEDKRR